MSGSNYRFLTYQISQQAGQVVWYSHLLKNFPQFAVIHLVKGFSIVSEADVFFWNSLAFFMIQRMLAIWFLVPLPFPNPPWTSGSSWFMYCLNPSLEDLEHYFASTWNECNCAVVWTLFGIALLWDWNEIWKSEGIYVFLELIHIVVWKKPTQHCKTVIL